MSVLTAIGKQTRDHDWSRDDGIRGEVAALYSNTTYIVYVVPPTYLVVLHYATTSSCMVRRATFVLCTSCKDARLNGTKKARLLMNQCLSF